MVPFTRARVLKTVVVLLIKFVTTANDPVQAKKYNFLLKHDNLS